MNGRHEERPLLIDCPRVLFPDTSSAGQSEPIECALSEGADRHSPTPHNLADSEADPSGFPKKLAKRGSRGVVDHDVLGVPDWDAGLFAAPSEFMVSAGDQTFIELAHETKHVPPNEKICRRGEAFLDVAVLAEKPARVDAFGG